MKHFPIYTPETATAPAGETLAALKQKLGFAPNVFAVMGGNPPVLAGFLSLNQNFAETSLSATEREIVQIAVSVENNGAYCVAGHTSFARKQNVADDIVTAVRSRGTIDDPKLAALHDFARRIAITRGNLQASDVEAFLAVGYTSAQVPEVILGVCVKMFSNFTDNILGIPLDEAFVPYKWHASEAKAGADDLAA